MEKFQYLLINPTVLNIIDHEDGSPCVKEPPLGKTYPVSINFHGSKYEVLIQQKAWHFSAIMDWYVADLEIHNQDQICFQALKGISFHTIQDGIKANNQAVCLDLCFMVYEKIEVNVLKAESLEGIRAASAFLCSNSCCVCGRSLEIHGSNLTLEGHSKGQVVSCCGASF